MGCLGSLIGIIFGSIGAIIGLVVVIVGSVLGLVGGVIIPFIIFGFPLLILAAIVGFFLLVLKNPESKKRERQSSDYVQNEEEVEDEISVDVEEWEELKDDSQETNDEPRG